MPNGNPDFVKDILPELERFFAPVARDLQAFANRHKLEIERYYHEIPSWQFRFDHPRGGEACIELVRLMANLVEIRLLWWNVYGKQPRLERTDAFTPDDDLVLRLEQSLTEVKNWTLANLQPVSR